MDFGFSQSVNTITGNNEHDRTPVKYLNVLHHRRTQQQLQQFFLIVCKKVVNFLFWMLWTYLTTFIKNDDANM